MGHGCLMFSGADVHCPSQTESLMVRRHGVFWWHPAKFGRKILTSEWHFLRWNATIEHVSTLGIGTLTTKFTRLKYGLATCLIGDALSPLWVVSRRHLVS